MEGIIFFILLVYYQDHVTVLSGKGETVKFCGKYYPHLSFVLAMIFK